MSRFPVWCTLAVAALMGVAVSSSAQWSRTAMPDGGYVYSLAVVDTTLFAGTANGVFKSSDYGLSWSSVRFADSTAKFLTARDGRLFADVSGRLFVSPDRGVTWTLANPSGQPAPILFLGASAEGVWVATGAYSGSSSSDLYLTTDAGDHWRRVGSCPNAIATLAANSQEVFVGGYNDVYIAERFGDTLGLWLAVEIDPPYGPYGVFSFVLLENELYAGSWGSGIHKSVDFATFQKLPNNGLTSANIRSLISDGSNLLAGTRNGVFRSGDNGTNWTLVGLAHTDVYALLRVGSFLFAGTGAGISRSSDDGSTWVGMSDGLQGMGVSCLMAAGDTVLLGTRSGLFRSLDGASSWVNLNLADENVSALARVNGDLYAGARRLLRSSDNGGTWTSLTDPICPGYCRSDVFLVTPTVMISTSTENGGMWRSSDGGVTWLFCEPYFASDIVKIGDTIIASWQGVRWSTDDGATWSFDWNNAMADRFIWDMAVIGTMLYAASGTQVFVSPDAGLTWSELSNGLPGGQVQRLSLVGTTLFATSGQGIAYLPENATAWIPINVDGLANRRTLGMAVTNSDFYVLAGGYSGTDEARDLWKRPLEEVFCCAGTTGNINLSGVVDLSDLSALVSYLTGGGYLLPCPAEANVNASGIVDLGDLSALVSFLTGGGYVLPACQ